MVVSKTGIFILAAMFVVVLLTAQLLDGLMPVGNTPLLMPALLLLAGGIGGWFARDQRIGMDTMVGDKPTN